MFVVAQIQEIRNNLSRLLGKVRITDGTNDMPAMDAAARAGYVKRTDGEHIAPSMDSYDRPGYQQVVDTPLACRLEWADSSTCYVGWAAAGAAGSAASWRIRKISVSGDNFTVTWADGNSLFDNIWDNRASLSYS